MSGIGLAKDDGYQLPEQQSASVLNAGAQAVTQPPAAPGIGLATVPTPPANDAAPPPDTAAAPAPAPAAAPTPTAPKAEPLIDFHKNPLGAIGLVLSAAAAGLNGTPDPVAKLKQQQLEEQAQKYKTADLALEVIGKTSDFVSKLPADQRKAAIADMDQRFSGALGGSSISPFLTALSDQSDAQRTATLQALQTLSPSPAMMAYWSKNPAAAMKFLEDYQQHQATKETPEEAAAKATAVTTATNTANADKPLTPYETAQISAGKTTEAEVRRHNGATEAQAAETAANKPLTNDQANAALFSDRAREANTILGNGASVSAQTSRIQRTKADLPGGNSMVSSDYQQADQAERNFVNAILRRESGAAIAPSEFDSAAKQYFPQPGDGPKVISQKAQNRATAIKGLIRASGADYQKQADPLGLR